MLRKEWVTWLLLKLTFLSVVQEYGFWSVATIPTVFVLVFFVVVVLFFNFSSSSFRTEISALVSIMNSVGVTSTVRIAPGLGRGLSPDSSSHHLLGEKPWAVLYLFLFWGSLLHSVPFLYGMHIGPYLEVVEVLWSSEVFSALCYPGSLSAYFVYLFYKLLYHLWIQPQT